MNKETLEYANKIIRVIKTLDDLNSVMCKPYPYFSCADINVNSAAFDKETLNKLKEVIKNFIDERQMELREEFKKL